MVYNIQELWGLIQLILKLKAFKYLSNKFQGMSVSTWRSNTDGEEGTTYTYPLSSSHFWRKIVSHCTVLSIYIDIYDGIQRLFHSHIFFLGTHAYWHICIWSTCPYEKEAGGHLHHFSSNSLHLHLMSLNQLCRW